MDQYGRVLLLQKSKSSKAASLFEFPGGKIDNIRGDVSSDLEQREAAFREVLEETGLNLNKEDFVKIDEFEYSFVHDTREFKRKVYVFCVHVSKIPVVSINLTRNAAGYSEDRHQGFIKIDREMLDTLRKNGRLSGNSVVYDKAFH
jgi:8-oxo-dGTP pyrophosphatase MutT (NUDIX family)